MKSPRWAPLATGAASVLVAAGGIVATLIVAHQQLSANREAEDRRAREALRLEAVSVVLEAPTCSSAEGRATLAQAVLGDILGDDFVQRVQSAARVRAFPNLEWNPFTAEAGEFGKAFRDELRRAKDDRDLLCSELGG